MAIQNDVKTKLSVILHRRVKSTYKTGWRIFENKRDTYFLVKR